MKQTITIEFTEKELNILIDALDYKSQRKILVTWQSLWLGISESQ